METMIRVAQIARQQNVISFASDVFVLVNGRLRRTLFGDCLREFVVGMRSGVGVGWSVGDGVGEYVGVCFFFLKIFSIPFLSLLIFG